MLPAGCQRSRAMISRLLDTAENIGSFLRALFKK
jgi:hypothetical protein